MKITNEIFLKEFEEFFTPELLQEYFSYISYYDRLKYLISRNLIIPEDTLIVWNADNILSYVLMFPNLDRKFFNGNLMLISHIDDVYEDDLYIFDLYSDYEIQESYKNNRVRNVLVEEFENSYIVYGDYKNRLGLGADDGLGVLSSLFLYNLFKKYDYEKTPIVLICNEEESGGIGAIRFAEDIINNNIMEYVSKEDVDKITYMIELDRKGCKNCVFYNNEPEEFRNYIKSFGFEEEVGTFTDITVLGNEFKKCAVNLSIGYFNNHSRTKEYAYIGCTKLTLYKVINMIYDNYERKRVWINPNGIEGLFVNRGNDSKIS
ncbi:MAG: hypothetical protein QXX12_01525 [Nanopusillaceae archaeon]